MFRSAKIAGYGSSQQAPNPANETRNAIPVAGIDEEIFCCPICFEEFDHEERIPFVYIKCGHFNCAHCVQQLWHSGKRFCPTCRLPFVIDHSHENIGSYNFRT